MKIRAFIAIFLTFLTVTVCFSGCGGDGTGKIIKYDIPNGVATLDPQRATDETARMIISNTFEGLLRQLPDGRVVPAVATGYEVSPDQLTYTFFLRKDAKWSDGTPVTAHDFAFAFSRMFDKTSFSPFAGQLASIENAQAILNGMAERDSLGVAALDDYTLEIRLVRPDNLLPELMASSFAMPCNEAFFLSTKARYGLELGTTIFNGPFYVWGWDNEKAINLRVNSHYMDASQVAPMGVNLYIPSESQDSEEDADPLRRFLAGATDACKIDFNLLRTVEKEGGSRVSFEDTVWVLVLNQEVPDLKNDNIRKAMAASVNRELFAEYMPENLRATSVLIPPAVSLAGRSFREFAGEGSPVQHSPQLARRELAQGIGDGAGVQIQELLICGEAPQPLLAGCVQRNFQQYLSLSTGLVRLSREELLSRVMAGEYEAAIVPLSAEHSTPEALFAYFRSGSEMNFSGYGDARFDSLLDSTSTLSGEEQLEVFRQAEQLLLSDCTVIPLYFETTYYAMAKGVSGVEFSPFLSGMTFRNAKKQ